MGGPAQDKASQWQTQVDRDAGRGRMGRWGNLVWAPSKNSLHVAWGKPWPPEPQFFPLLRSLYGQMGGYPWPEALLGLIRVEWLQTLWSWVPLFVSTNGVNEEPNLSEYV